MSSPHFNYAQAFSRNIGWVTPADQELLRGKQIERDVVVDRYLALHPEETTKDGRNDGSIKPV